MTPAINKGLLFEHFANKTTPLQKRLIEEWLHQGTNQELFYAWLVEWENTHAPYQPDLEAPLQRFVKQMDAHPFPLSSSESGNSENVLPLHRSRPRLGWVAAASVLILLASVGWFNRTALLYQTYQTVFGQKQTINLPDGSRVTLNAQSTLQVPRFGFGGAAFGNHAREVILTGEADFAVVHYATNQEFIVKTERGFDVVVHGTEFTVNTSPHRANVMLRTGKVQINYVVGRSQKQLLLKPGDLVTLDQPDQPKLQHHVEPQTYSAWKEHRFMFNNMTLTDFGKLLNETYGIRVEIPDSTIAKRTLAGSFQASNADELLQIVSELFNLSVVRQDDKILLVEPN